MALSNRPTLDDLRRENGEDRVTTGEVFRVIDDGTCVLTTMDARKALTRLQEVLDKHDVTVAWAENEVLE